jgi:rSAM/selenodomain-associated transferase 1
MNDNPLLLVFVRNPVLGKVKTRLARTIGPQKALQVYHLLLQYTLQTVQGLHCRKRVCYADFVPATDQWQEAGFQPAMQRGDNLGDRMLDAFRQAFSEGYGPVVIIGSDCAEITAPVIEEAFHLLRTQPVVIGPAVDGGYYLLGMNRLVEGVFREKTWSSPSLLTETIHELNRSGIAFGLLPVLSDIDEASDLDRLPAAWLNTTQ